MGNKTKKSGCGSESISFDNAAFHMKRRPEVCVRKGFDVIATIWQIGHRQFFIGKGKEKISKKTGAYLGTIEVEADGSMTFLMCDPLQRPSHSPRRIPIKSTSYMQLLADAYTAYNEILKAKVVAA